jgi:hypothetical protein
MYCSNTKLKTCFDFVLRILRSFFLVSKMKLNFSTATRLILLACRVFPAEVNNGHIAGLVGVN